MGSEEFEVTIGSSRNDVRRVAKRALLQLLEPLAGFAIDAGLSTSELHSLLRQAAVWSVAARQLEVSHRVNISGIAATTGIPRAAIAKILKSGVAKHDESANRGQKSTSRILAAWHEESRFTDSNGQPADLKLYGRGATFETLVKSHGRGIPARAVLDELVRASAVEVLSSQKIRAKTSLAVDRRITPQAIEAFGILATELLSVMLLKLREPENPQFVANVSKSSVESNAMPFLREELFKKRADFLADVQKRLTEAPNHSKRRSRISVTVFCHESLLGRTNNMGPPRRRNNFRRNTN